MAKGKTVWFCQSCGVESPKWQGKCSACGAWNSFVEEHFTATSTKRPETQHLQASKPILVSEVNVTDVPRIETGNGELDRVLGGGIVPGSLILLGGEPGIGKSTLILQTALRLNKKILYVSGEESPQQIKLRADRIEHATSNCYLVGETSLERIMDHWQNVNPELIIIDSIQTLESQYIESTPGSVSQIRDCTARILKVAKEKMVPVILIGHITKEGVLAGPKVLEHIVDVVLQFEGDGNYMYRILRSIKNRFGATSEIGIFEMQQSGLREVTNPSEMLLGQHEELISGVSVAATLEGMRPFLVEVQALVSSAAYGVPQRSSTGFDLRRLNMLLAVLEKRAGFKLGVKDVFLNIAGGLKISDPAIDLSIVAAIISSNIDIPQPMGVCLAGEVGLTGEIRQVNRIEQRVLEAAKLGFKKIIVPKYTKGVDFSKAQIEVFQASKIEEAFRYLFT